jgi:hypothetical protein
VTGEATYVRSVDEGHHVGSIERHSNGSWNHTYGPGGNDLKKIPASSKHTCSANGHIVTSCHDNTVIFWRVFKSASTKSRISLYSTDDEKTHSNGGAGAFWILVRELRTFYVMFLKFQCRWRETNPMDSALKYTSLSSTLLYSLFLSLITS